MQAALILIVLFADVKVTIVGLSLLSVKFFPAAVPETFSLKIWLPPAVNVVVMSFNRVEAYTCILYANVVFMSAGMWKPLKLAVPLPK